MYGAVPETPHIGTVRVSGFHHDSMHTNHRHFWVHGDFHAELVTLNITTLPQFHRQTQIRELDGLLAKKGAAMFGEEVASQNSPKKHNQNP